MNIALTSRASFLVVVAQVLVLASSLAAQDSNSDKLRSLLKDYVSCQFTTDDEKVFDAAYRSNPKTEYGANVTAIQSAVVDAASTLATLDSTQKKPVSDLTKSVMKAQTEVGVTAAIDNSALDPAYKETLKAKASAAGVTRVGEGITAPNDVLCSQSILSWGETRDIFGRHMANTYLAFQVVVRNINQDSDFLIHDVQIQVPHSHFRAGRDKQLARGVSIYGQARDPRNMVMSGLDTLAATSAAVALIGGQGAMLTESFRNLQNANNVLTAFIPPLKRWFPDYTVDQLNRLNDLGFSSSSTSKIIVPKGGSVPFVTFISQDLFPNKSGGCTKAGIFPTKEGCWSPAEFLRYNNTTLVLVAGAHIQEVPGPSIGSLVPSSGSKGTAVTINGTNFGSTQGSNGSVKFGSLTQNVTSWSASAIVVPVPNLPAGSTTVVVSTGGKDSAPATFTVICPDTGPCITNISPLFGPRATQVTITGKNFGTAVGTVKFADTNAPAVPAANWTDTSIMATVPDVAVGSVNVVVSAGSADSPPASFTVNCPSAPVPCVTSLSAKTVAAAGGTLIITGTGFGASPGTVTIGSTNAPAVPAANWADTKVTVTVPAGLANGAQNVVVTVAGAGGQHSPPAPFTAP